MNDYYYDFIKKDSCTYMIKSHDAIMTFINELIIVFLSLYFLFYYKNVARKPLKLLVIDVGLLNFVLTLEVVP